MESKILSSQQKRCELEFQIYLDLKIAALKEAKEALILGSQLASVDLALSWAQLAVERNYCRPEISAEGIELKDSRHPFLENFRPEKLSPEKLNIETFIPNDISLKSGHCLLLTGPNMAGKSTLMRQVALSAILFHCGSFVPAAQARLP